MTLTATARAHVNIALVKYWGKRDAALNLPAAGSLSATLAGLTTTTTVTFDDTIPEDHLVIGGVEASPAALTKALRVIDPLRQRAGILQHRVMIRSENDFPTGAGLASSASGLAALTLAAAKAAGLELPRGELSALARRGSGSASRSLFGGFARWDAGVRDDGADSHARPLFGPDHWDLRVIVAVVSSERKRASSTDGMDHTAATSPYHPAFVAAVETDLDAAEDAIAARAFTALGRVAERSCLRMHADMLAADPPLVYLRPESWRVIETVRDLQDQGLPIFFTADAGPNIKIFALPEALPSLRASLDALGDVLENTIETGLGANAEIVG